MKMNITMKKITITILSCACIAATAVAGNNAFSGSDDSPGLPGKPLRTILSTVVRELLDFRHDTPLSAGQKSQIAAILETHRAEIHTQMEHARDARRAMLDAVNAAGASSPAATDAAAKIGDAARDRALLTARIGSEIKPLLTPEQQSRLQNAIKDVESTVDSVLAQ